MVSRFLIGFIGLDFLTGESRICQTDEELPIGL